MTFTSPRAASDLEASVEIYRDAGRVEVMPLKLVGNNPSRWMSTCAPEEPHEFAALLRLRSGNRKEALPFRMSEPEDHH